MDMFHSTDSTRRIMIGLITDKIKDPQDREEVLAAFDAYSEGIEKRVWSEAAGKVRELSSDFHARGW